MATLDSKSPLEMFYRWEHETPDQVYLRQSTGSQWVEYTWRDVANQVRRIASYLRSKEYPAGSRIAIWSSNSKDWPIVDLAIMLAGHISVPIYPGQDIESANYIFNHSEARLVFAGAFDRANNVSKALTEGMETTAMMGCSFDCETSLEEICANFEPYTDSPIPDPEDVFTLVYTSGTTGNPKGVMHMHQTPGHVVPGLIETFGMNKGENRLFSFLPMSHVAERIMVEMTSLYGNVPVSFSQGLATFNAEIRSVQPTFLFAVPRLWVKFKEGIDAKIPAEVQAQFSDEQKAGVAEQLGLAKAKFILTGSAPCPRDVQDWFLGIGIPLRDGYGMTENFIHGCAWLKDDKPISGCVGQAMNSSVQVRLSDTDEILFKSKGLMKGYYLNPEKTAEAFEDGWYRTGDSGRFDEEGNLWLTGRVGEVFKTSKGKFIVPTRVENFFGRSNSLAQLCIMGHGFDQPVLLATRSEMTVGRDTASLEEELEGLLQEVNAELAAHERVQQLFLCPEWTIESGLLTPTLKLKRKQIEEAYRPQVEQNLAGQRVISLE